MKFSFIIPAYNEQALIGATLASIREAIEAVGEAIAAYEIIVVNDASTDRTADIAAEHGARVINVEKRHIAAVRNAGARAANGDVFVFVDADTIVPAGVLRAVVRELHRGTIGGGAAVRFDDDIPWLAKWLASVSVQLFITFRIAAGCFVYCRREAFEAVGGFDEKFFASEEVWISRALGKQGRFVVVRTPVVSSGRKVRFHGLVPLLGKMLWMTLRGPRHLQKRDGLDLWYDGRRETS